MMTSLPNERTPGEKQAYLDGFKAGVKFYHERLVRHRGNDDPLFKAALAEVNSVAEMIEESIQ